DTPPTAIYTLSLHDALPILVAMPYTLLDQPALDEELPLCVERGAGVVIGAPFASGILARGAASGATYGYAPPNPEILDRTRRIRSEEHTSELQSLAYLVCRL